MGKPIPVVLLVFLAFMLCLTSLINHYAPEQYMDEPFHVPQTQRYCAGDWAAWDPKITTLPGLYILGAAYAAATRWLLSWTGVTMVEACSTAHLRSLSALLAVACLQLLYACSLELHQAHNRQQQQQQPQQQQVTCQRLQDHAAERQPLLKQQMSSSTALLVAITLSLLPTHFFYGVLYYTDVASLAAVLLTHLLLLKRMHYAAALAGAAAVMVRQTNAVWVTFLAAATLLQELYGCVAVVQSKKDKGNDISEQRVHSQQQEVRPFDHLPLHQELLQLMQVAWQERARVVRNYALLALLPAGFAAFIVINGGIAVGDRSAHAPVLHLVQPLYFALFTLGMAAPLLVLPGLSAAQAVLQGGAARKAASIAAFAAAACAAAIAVSRYTLVHPYLVADNRHYTFYIWKRVFERHWAVRYALSPAYVAAWWVLGHALCKVQGRVWLLGYVASVIVTLAPAWLLEPRYFTTPLVLALLHMQPPPRTALLVSCASYAAINAATLCMFTQRPFIWGDGTVARFMW